MKKSLAVSCTLLLSILFGFLFVSCGGPLDLLAAAELSDAKEITSFVFRAAYNAALSADAIGTISGTAISVEVLTADVTALVPTITVSAGASVSPSSGKKQDFSNPVSYTVTAENKTTQVYTAAVTDPNAKEITSFVFRAADNAALSADVTGTISGAAISATVPTGTAVTALVPTITVSAGASVSPASGEEWNFSNPVRYTVTAENSTTQVYTATVRVTLITVSPTSGLVTTEEGGGTDTFTVVLNTQPTADVTIEISSDDTSEGLVSDETVNTPSPNLTLSFTDSNWSEAQTITVTGVDDTERDGDQEYTLVTAPAISDDLNYNGIDPADVSVTNTDDEHVESITVTPSNPTIVVGTTQQFTATGAYSDGGTVDLTSQVTWTSSNSSVATIDSSGLASGGNTGTTEITATLEGISGSSTLAVVNYFAKTYGGIAGDGAESIQITTDGGFIVAGSTSSFGAGGSDYWILKLNGDGTVEWQKTYGGNNHDLAYSIQETSDGGFIVAGETVSFGAEDTDGWILKLNGNGTIAWQKAYEGGGSDSFYSIQETTDGRFVVAGMYGSTLGGYWIMKLNGDGTIVWKKNYGGGDIDEACFIQETSAGGFIVAGETQSFSTGVDSRS